MMVDFVLDVLKDLLYCRESEDYENKKKLRNDSFAAFIAVDSIAPSCEDYDVVNSGEIARAANHCTSLEAYSKIQGSF
jgi:hypothetical protein